MHWRTRADRVSARASAASSNQVRQESGTFTRSSTHGSTTRIAAVGSDGGGVVIGASLASPPGEQLHLRGMIAVPVFQVTAGVIVALFLIQVARRLTSQSSNPIAVGVNDGLSFLTS